MILTILRLIAFVFSFIGSWEMIRRKTGIHIYFLPSLTVAIQTSLLFIAGLFNILLEVTILLFLLGIAGLIFCIVKDKGIRFLKYYCKVGFLFFAIAFVILFIAVQGRIFIHYDNFSHWALVVRQMLLANRFPNSADLVIEFQQYPLGSAAYIYFFSRLVGTAESVQMFAQAYMMLSCMVPLFLFCRKNQWASLICMLAAADLLLVYNISITNLLVDTLLPLASMCSFAYAQKYGRQIQSRAAFFMILFYLIWLVQIKNAGLFFAAFVIIWILIGIRKDRHVPARLIVILIPVASVYLWHLHCSLAFEGALATKHAMSPGYYASVFAEKTSESIREIIHSVLRFSVSWREVWLVFGLVLLVGILVFLFAREERKEYLRTAVFSVILFILFQLGLIWMYLFSMPAQEAAYLAEIERYTRSILIAVLYLTMMTGIKLISGEQRKTLPTAVFTGLILAGFCGIMLVSFGKIRTIFENTEDPSERILIENAIEEYEVPSDSSYCILTNYEDGGYSFYLGKYLFQTTEVYEAFVTEPSDLEGIPSQYIFIVDQENEIIREWVNHNYPEQAGNTVIIVNNRNNS